MKINYLSREDIYASADNFRQTFSDTLPPIDIIYITEVKLEMEVIPTPNLFSEISMDAALSPNLETIYVDEEAYLSWEAGQSWIEKRLRFSFAHELGHKILHGDLIKQNQFKSLDDLKQWIRSTENQRSEYQANEFAGRLLVPIDLLKQEYDLYISTAQTTDPNWLEIEGMRNHIAKKIAPRFGVNPQVIEVRLDREGIWPVE